MTQVIALIKSPEFHPLHPPAPYLGLKSEGRSSALGQSFLTANDFRDGPKMLEQPFHAVRFGWAIGEFSGLIRLSIQFPVIPNRLFSREVLGHGMCNVVNHC
jgi:hypothetical protein